MNSVLDFLKPKLSEEVYLREDITQVINTLKDLEVIPSQEFIDFYNSYSNRKTLLDWKAMLFHLFYIF